MTSTVTNKVAPGGGWNTVAALASMPPEDAVILDNWFPGTTGVTKPMPGGIVTLPGGA